MITEYNNEEILDTLLLRHNVTLTAVYNCAAEQFDNLNNMEDIFDLKTEEEAKRLVTMPHLFFNEAVAELIVACFRKEESDNQFLAAVGPDLEGCKVILLSAFVYNPSFFSMAWNWCAYLQDKVRKQQEQSKPNLRLVKSETTTERSDVWNKVIVFPAPLPKYYKTAATAGNHSFGEPTSLEGIGKLYQFTEEAGGRYYFQFLLSITNEQLQRPFVLEIDFTTVKDGKTHHVRIEDTSGAPEKDIWSGSIRDIDVSHGIEIHGWKFKPV